MEYCFTTNLDLLEIFKALTPYILALVVYFVWHKQKGKEVIAYEAKENIKSIVELNKILLPVISVVFKKDKEETILKITEYFYQFNEISRNLNLLYDFTNSDTQNKISTFRKNNMEFISSLHRANKFITPTITEDEENDLAHKLSLIYETNLKFNNVLITTLSKYALYKKL